MNFACSYVAIVHSHSSYIIKVEMMGQNEEIDTRCLDSLFSNLSAQAQI